MIASMRGVVTQLGNGAAVVEVGGMGYLVHLPTPAIAGLQKGLETQLVTHLVVREDSMTLFGFENTDQRSLFELLIATSGVGPKLALAVLSALTPDQLRSAVAAADVDALTQVPGIGRRGAERMIVELKEKLGDLDLAPVAGSKVAEVRGALAGLGYTPAEIREALSGVDGESMEVEEMLRAALRGLSNV